MNNDDFLLHLYASSQEGLHVQSCAVPAVVEEVGLALRPGVDAPEGTAFSEGQVQLEDAPVLSLCCYLVISDQSLVNLLVRLVGHLHIHLKTLIIHNFILGTRPPRALCDSCAAASR